jgi:signal transduction histidine kinase
MAATMSSMNGAGTVAGARARDPWRWAEGRVPLLAGAALALAAVVQIALEPLPTNAGPGAALPPKIFLVLIALATTLPLGVLWAQPRTTAVIVATASLLSLGLVHIMTVAGVIAFIVAMTRLGYLGAQALAGCVAVAVLISAVAQPDTSQTRAVLILLAGALPLGCWAGYARRVRRESALRTAQDEMMADSALAHSMRGERARISRELHDVVAHHISMIAVQAEAARLTTQGMPPAGAQRLLAIGDTARAALTEMRRLLGVLREDGAAEQLRRPQPGLAQLNDLLDEIRDASGAATRLIVSGWLVALDPGVELAAYRIVQEALTNARRHAPGAAIDVELRYHDGGLYVRVRDNGPGPALAAGNGGHGLLGMQERAVAVGGTLRTGPAPGGGFLVEATLPAAIAEDAA